MRTPSHKARLARPRATRLAGMLLCGLLVSHCDDPRSNTTPPVRARPDRATTSASAAAPTASASTTPSAAAAPTSCPKDMALVHGDYCPAVMQVCKAYPARIAGTPRHHCKRYGEARCLSKERVPMHFCMDIYEWPNKRAQRPRTLVSWPEARSSCEAIGKRLCTEAEFNYACEGDAMNAHVYGNTRDDTQCHFDRPYIARTYNYKPWDECMQIEACKREYERLDQRKPSGSMPGCVSQHGVHDLNGNVNEWVFRTDQQFPKRSGLKGGWWGPVRNRCRPMTTFHPEGDYGYEVGFRCCKDAD